MSKSELAFVDIAVSSGLLVTINGSHVTVVRGQEEVSYKRATLAGMKPSEAEALSRATVAAL